MKRSKFTEAQIAFILRQGPSMGKGRHGGRRQNATPINMVRVFIMPPVIYF